MNAARILSLVIALTGVLLPSMALSQEHLPAHRRGVALPSVAGSTAPAASDDGPPSRRWYGWQSLIADGVAYGLGIGLLVDGTNRPPGTGFSFGGSLPLYVTFNTLVLLGTPIVHWAHGNIETGFGSLGLRLVPIGIMFYGAVADDGGIIVAGGLVGLGIAALDAFALSYQPLGSTTNLQRTARPSVAGWSLGFTGTRGGTIVAVGATF